MDNNQRKKQVAIIGTQGVPAHYGGFESLVENIIGSNQSPDIHYTIFCSSPLMDRTVPRYKNADLKYVGINAHGPSSVAYDIVSLCRSLKGYDSILVLGVSGCISLPLLKRMTKARIIVNIDGHEYRRNKWGALARHFLRISEAMAVKYADVVVADNRGIQKYVSKVYKRDALLIAYGGNQVVRDMPLAKQLRVLDDYNLRQNDYALALCRIEPENNCHIILHAFRDKRRVLAFVGNWGHSEYSKQLYREFSDCPNIHLIDSIYDLDVLYALRNNADCYIHGHSAGGTNPSLVEAMFFSRPILAFNVVYNRETTFDKAYYFNNTRELSALLDTSLLPSDEMLRLAETTYDWQTIARQYEALFR